MPIRDNTFSEETTNFYKSHFPFVIPSETFATNDLKKMLFINYSIPEESVKINQIFGAEEFLNFTVTIRNVTINIPLEIQIIPSNFFNISVNNLFTLVPGAPITLEVTGNNSYINSQVQPLIQAHFKILAKNLSNEVAYIPTNLASVPQITFPSQIVIQ